MTNDGEPTAFAAASRQRHARHDASPESASDPDVREHGGTIPILTRHFVPRDRLWECLNQSSRMGVTVVISPVGTGKTLGIAGWLRTRGHDHEDAVWVHADAALTPQRLQALLDRASRGADSVRRAGTRPRLIVIDDAHRLSTQAVRVIDDLLRSNPYSLRLVLASRWDLPLNRVIPELLGHLTILRGAVLRMTDDEAATLVASHLRDPDDDVVRAVVAWAQGWSALLVLASHAIGRASDPMAEVRRLARGGAPVADQVASEVFATLTVPQRHLLLCLSGEEAFDVGLATHLSNDRHAGEILEDLEATGLLVTRIPAATEDLALSPVLEGDASVDSGARFLIHPLMQEVVRRRLAVDSVDVRRARATVRRAVRLDLESGQAPHALARLVRLWAMDEAAEVLARDGVHMLLGPGHSEEIAAVTSAYPEMVDGHPSTWFPMALDRWLADDPEGVQHWTARIVASATDEDLESRLAVPGHEFLTSREPPGPAQVACSHLWRARMGLEPLEAAIHRAERVVARILELDQLIGADVQVVPLLLVDLGAAQGWIGEFDEAATNLATAMVLCRNQGHLSMSAAVMTHLAMNEFMAGHDHAAAEIATEAFGLLGEHGVGRLIFSPSRAGLALFLSSTVALAWTAAPASPPFEDTGRRTHSCDLTGRFWFRVRDAILAAWSGSVSSARAVLEAPGDDPRLREASVPLHLRVALLVGKSLLAAMAADPATLEQLESDLVSLGAAEGEGRFVAGLRADCQGDRKTALAAFADAAEAAVCRQPPVQALALGCAAQLLDSLGETDNALDWLSEAAAQTEARRNGTAFLGWSRLGSPMEGLLRRLDARGDSPWVHELAVLAGGHSDVISTLEPSTPIRLEQYEDLESLAGPPLSPREREVLGELARGATYADIGNSLFLSPNTVKTHVSSLYAKLGVSRRSDALAVARSHHIL